MVSSRFAHILHVCLFILLFLIVEIISGTIIFSTSDSVNLIVIDPIELYGLPLTILIYIIRLLPLLPLPIIICHTCGLLRYNVFPEQIVLKTSPLLAPRMVIRVVTRGDYPHLIHQTVKHNMETCFKVGLENFIIEIVTDKSIKLFDLPTNKVHELVVPREYRTKTGALYKARALQYALESSVNLLSNDTYIVHLDEETLLTENSLRGILNFMCSNEYDIGQGLITYANGNIVNIWTTFADSARVGIDLGCLRFCLKKFNRPLFIFKGSYVVCRAACELEVAFDNGIAGSIAEDIYFALLATSKNKRFGWIEGEMWERSSFTIIDFIKQRKRWIQGISLVVHERRLPWQVRFFLGIGFYSWVTLPLSILNIIVAPLCPIPLYWSLKFLISYIGAVAMYLYIIGTIRSFPLARYGFIHFILRVICTILTIPLAVSCEIISVPWGLLSDKSQFYVINKQITSMIEV